jgi:hypothetical protein
MEKNGWPEKRGFPLYPEEIRPHWIHDLRDGTISVWMWIAPYKYWSRLDQYFSQVLASDIDEFFLYLGEAKRKPHPIADAWPKNTSDLYFAPEFSSAQEAQVGSGAGPKGEIDYDQGDLGMTGHLPIKAEVDALKAEVLALRNGAVAASEAMGYFMEERTKMTICADEVTMERDRLLQIIRHMEPNEEVDDLAKMIAQAIARAEGYDPWSIVTSGDGVKQEWQRFMAEAREIANAAVERSSRQTFS